MRDIERSEIITSTTEMQRIGNIFAEIKFRNLNHLTDTCIRLNDRFIEEAKNFCSIRNKMAKDENDDKKNSRKQNKMAFL